MKNKLSVIIPVYNTEKYLSKCLQSIINQTYKNIEVILINDGSTDRSFEIMEDFSKNYGFIKLYNRRNHGIAEERNFGIQQSTGDYFTFLDSDDYVDEDLYFKCMEYLNKNELDIIMHDFIIEFDEKKAKSTVVNFKDKNEMYLKNLPNPWNKIIKRDFWLSTQIEFPKGIWYEDLATLPKLYLYTNKIEYFPIYGYHYIIRSNSITHRVEYDSRCMDILKSLKILKDTFAEKNKLEDLESIFIIEGLYFGTQAPVEFNQYDDYKKILQFVESTFPDWRKNKTISNLHFIKRFYLKFIKNYSLLRVMIKIRKKIKI